MSLDYQIGQNGQDKQAGEKPARTAAAIVDGHAMLPLEPRLLMDASLEWDLTGGGHIIDLLSGVHQLLADQLDSYDDFLDQFQDLADQAVDDLSPLSSASTMDNHALVAEMVTRLRDAIEALGTAADSEIDDLFADQAGDDFDDELAADLNTALGLSGGDVVTGAEVDAVYSAAKVKDGTINTAIDGFVSALMTRVDPADYDTAAELRTAVDGVVQTYLAARSGGSLNVDLVDITNGTDTIVAYVEDALSGGVDVTVALPGLEVDLSHLSDAIIANLSGVSINAGALEFASASEARFELKGTTTAGSVGLDVTDVEIDPLVDIGGAIGATGLGAQSLGLLSAQVDGLVLSQFQIAVDLGADANLGGAVDLTSRAFTAADTVTVAGGLQIKEVGAADFTAVEADETYIVAAAEISGALDLLDGVVDAGKAAEFAGRITLTTVLNPTAASPAARAAAFLAAQHGNLDIDLSDVIADADTRERLESAVEALAAMDSDVVLQFLRDSGALLAGLLRSSLFNIDVPFTDLDMATIYRDIATVFDSIDDAFMISPTTLGYAAGEAVTENVSGAITEIDTPAAFDPAALNGIAELNFVVINGNSEDDLHEVTVVLDSDAWTDSGSTLTQRADAFAEMLNEELSDYGLTVSIVGGKLRIAATDPNNLPALALVSAVDDDDDTLSWFGLGNLGFTGTQLYNATGVFEPGNGETEKGLNLLPAQSARFAPGENFVSGLADVDRLTYSAKLITDAGNTFYDVVIERPAGGWGTGSTPNYAGLANSFNSAFAASGAPLIATYFPANPALMTPDMLVFSAAPAAGTNTIEFGIEPDKLVRAHDANGLVEWVNNRLAATSSLTGVELRLGDDGALLLDFPDITKSVTGTTVNFDADGLAVDDLENLSLQARLSAAVSATFGVTAGIDLVAYGAALVDGGTGGATLLELAGDLSSPTDANQSRYVTALREASFAEDMSMSGSITATGTGVTGSGDLGLINFDITGGTENSIELGTDFSIAIADTTDGDATRIGTLRLLEAASAGAEDEELGYPSIIGTSDVGGTIATDGAGAAGGSNLSQLFVDLGAISVNADGIDGIESDLISGITLSIDALDDAANTTAMQITGDNAEAVAALAKLTTGDIKDSFQSVLNLVEGLGNVLETQLGFLSEKLPLLNFALADKIKLAEDLAQMVADLRGNAELGFADLNAALQDAMGADAVTVTWNADDQKLEFELSFDFLADFAEDLPFKIDLKAILGDGYEDYLDDLAEWPSTDVADLAKAMTSLMDVAGDADLSFDPDLSMVFKFDIDLSGVLETGDLATADTLLTDLTTVVAVIDNTTGTSGADLRFDLRATIDGSGGAVAVNLGNVTTVGEAVDRINTALQTKFGSTASAVFDDATGVITITDSRADALGIEIKVTDVGTSNFGRLLGFDTAAGYVSGAVTSIALTETGAAGAGKGVALNTEDSGIRLEMTAGAEEGLNLKLGLGPTEINVADGVAYLTAGGETEGPAFIGLSFLDADGTDDGAYDLGDLFALANDDARDANELYAAEIGIGVAIELAFEDDAGYLNPDDHGLTYVADLIVTDGVQALADLAADDPSEFVSGDAVDGEVDTDTDFDLRLPVEDLVDMLDDFSILSYLNDPLVLLDGLDAILEQIQGLVDDFVSDINLPLIGNQLKSATTFFDDIRFGVLADVRAAAETPDPETGELPTTVDLITGLVNDLLNDLFGFTGSAYTEFFQVHLHEGTADLPDPYLYGTLNFGAKIWEGFFDVDLNLGGFGFELDIEEGSQVRLALDYFVNLGFGVDSNGFFLLNMQSEPEISIGITADAGSFEGSAKLFGLLGVKVDALDYDEDDGYSGKGAGEGTAYVTGRIGIDLFSDQGEDILDPEIPEVDEIGAYLPGKPLDLSGVTPLSGDGRELGWDSIIYLNELDTTFEKLVELEFAASVQIILGLEGNILDPTDADHDPILIGGKQIIPSVFTELRFAAFYNYNPFLEEDERHTFEITELAFDNVRINARDLYDVVIAPVLDPIMEFIEPLVDAFGWLNDVPFNYIVDMFKPFFPILGIVDSVLDVLEDIRDFQNQMATGDGTYSFGSFDYTDELALYYATEGGEKEPELNEMNAARGGNRGPSGFGVFGNTKDGIAIEIPLLSDYNNVINLLMGDYANVDLIKLHMTLFNLEIPRINFASEMLDEIGAPGWVSDIISSVFKFEMGAHFRAGLSVGYDLSGIVNFINTMDAERLLDGVFIDASKGSLISAGFDIFLELNLGIAGLRTGGGVSIDLGFNDPNNDNKLRIPELIAILDAAADAVAAGDVGDAFSYIFEGEFNIEFFLELWAGIVIDFGFFEIDLTWDTTVVDIDESITFGGKPLPTGPAPVVADGQTAILAVGANAGASMSNITKDGDDIITLDGPNSPIQVSLSTNQGSMSGSLNQNVGGIIIPAGEGNNTVNLGQLNDNTAYAAKPVIVYTGGGTDTIVLPPRGVTVVFSGEGTDTITAAAGSTGTYVIFGEKGTDNVNIQGGNVIFIGDDDFGMRDLLVQTYASGNLTESNLCAILGINADGTVNAGAAANYTTAAGTKVNLHNLLTDYTRITQSSANTAVENITLGSGNHVILTGGGNDNITVTGTTGTVKVYSGAGHDVLRLGGADLYVEAGAGADRIFTSATASEVWGWGKQAGENGLLADGTTAGRAIDAMALRDGRDLMVGGSGADKFFGQLGDDVLEGGLGADIIAGGAGIDLIAGGKFNITTTAGATIDLATFNPLNGFGRAINVATQDLADGADSLRGGDESDVLLGGGGNDTVEGERGADVVIGDFATMRLSANLIVEALETIFDTSSNAGTDVLRGGQGNDILIAGGSSAGVEAIVDTEGSNVVIGDFGRLSGARLADAVTFATSFASNMGGADSIVLGDGNDLVLGGEGNDTIRTGNGGDLIIADLGTVDITNKVVKADSTASATTAGDDVVMLGDGAGVDIADLVILGRGDDSLTTSGVGGLVALGDDGVVNLNVAALAAMRGYIPPGDVATRAKIETLAKTVESWADAGSGDDTISAATAALTAVTGGGDDTVTMGTKASYVLTDDGLITRELQTNGLDLKSVQLVASTHATAGDDSITAGSANGLFVMGLGDDSITAGSGNHSIMTDEGTLDRMFIGATAGVTLTGANSTGGDDVLVAGDGDLHIMLGYGNDSATVGNGDIVLMADHGVMEHDATTIDMTDSAPVGGNDTVVAGNGDVSAVLGLGNDTATIGKGKAVVLGDQGTLHRTSSVIEIADTSSLGGNDVLTAGLNGADDGDVTAIMGLGDDSATLGHGDNVISGDKSEITRTAAQIDIADTANAGGNDTLVSGDGNVTAIMGLGDDSATLGDGANVISGDKSEITRTATQIDIADTASTGGDDTLVSGDGNVTAIMGLGDDSATLGDGANVIATDKAEVTRTASRIQIEDTDAFGGNDTLVSGNGNVTAILGLGNDTATTGNGNSALLGDKGQIDRFAARITMEDSVTAGGNDVITSGTGNDSIIAGSGNDSVTGNNGNNIVFGDTGSITTQDSGAAVLISPQRVADGNDTISTGNGLDRVILGGGADSASLGDGLDYLLGDSGVITDAVGAAIDLTTTSNDIGGSDTVDGQGGNDMIIGGAAGDSLIAGTGDDYVLGDQGSLTASASGRVTAISEDKVNGGDDSITGDAGRDVIIAGLGADSVSGGAGDDAILGDLGRYIAAAGTSGTALGSMTGLLAVTPANDSINGDADDDMIIAGLGNDSIHVGVGEDFALGDSGTITFANTADLVTILLTERTIGGDDTIIADGATGDDILAGQMGNDSIDAAGSDDLILGDSAVLRLLDPSLALTSQSAADRVLYIEGILTNSAGDDTIEGDAGLDLVLAGYGADSVDGGDDQDVLIGDSAIVVRLFSANSGGSVFTEMTIDTNFAYITGGVDTVIGADGPDIMIGGLGDDLFYGDTARDLIYSDGFAGLFEVTQTNGYASVPMAPWKMIKSNFAGQGAVDVVSDSQQAASIGHSLNLLTNDIEAFLPEFLNQGDGGEKLDAQQVLEIVASQPGMLEAVAQMLIMGADAGLIAQSIITELVQGGMLAGQIDALQLEMLIQAISAQIGDQAAVTTTEPLAIAAE